MRRFAFHTLDVFTAKPLSGNSLAVIHGADELDTEEMQAIARETNLSETVFVLQPHNPVHTARIRIFTPTREVPFAGHPTIGTAVLLAEQKFGAAEKHEAIIVLEEHIGAIRCIVQIHPNGATGAEFDTPKLSSETGKAPPRERLAAALGLVPSDIGFDNHKPIRLSSGLEFLFVPVRDRDALHRAKPVIPVWMESVGMPAFIYTKLPEEHDSDYRARMFSPDMGIVEDPATGSAVAALAGALTRFEGLHDGWHERSIEQGVEMGRPSRLQLEFEIVAGRLTGTRIGGQAVVVSEGFFTI
jgi:trans-2,3-dihydro-3-hydroxyanthranilate isomerase